MDNYSENFFYYINKHLLSSIYLLILVTIIFKLNIEYIIQNNLLIYLSVILLLYFFTNIKKINTNINYRIKNIRLREKQVDFYDFLVISIPTCITIIVLSLLTLRNHYLYLIVLIPALVSALSWLNRQKDQGIEDESKKIPLTLQTESIKDDLFDRGAFIDEIANILNREDRLNKDNATAIIGGWGSGKSFLIAKAWQKHIETRNKKTNYINIYISTQDFTNDNDLINYIYEHIQSNIRKLKQIDISNSLSNYLSAITEYEPKIKFINLFYYKSYDKNNMAEEINQLLINNTIKLNIIIDDFDRANNVDEIFLILKLDIYIFLNKYIRNPIYLPNTSFKNYLNFIYDELKSEAEKDSTHPALNGLDIDEIVYAIPDNFIINNPREALTIKDFIMKIAKEKKHKNLNTTQLVAIGILKKLDNMASSGLYSEKSHQMRIYTEMKITKENNLSHIPLEWESRIEHDRPRYKPFRKIMAILSTNKNNDNFNFNKSDKIAEKYIDTIEKSGVFK